MEEVGSLTTVGPLKKDHFYVLKNLLSQIKPLDFRSRVYPEADELHEKLAKLNRETTNPDGSVKEDEPDKLEQIKQITKRLEGLKIYLKHYLIIVVEELLEIAKQNDWDLCQRHGFYYIYNGSHWLGLEGADLEAFLGKAAEKMGVPRFDSRYYDFKEKLFKQFEATAHLPEPEVDDDTVLINLQNGTAEITPKGLKLREHRAEDFLTYQLPFSYDPEARAPKFEKYLNEVLPDEESRRVLAEFIGSIFLRNLKLEVVLFLLGSGRNGKSVLFNIIRALLGEEAVSFYSLYSLTSDENYCRAKLENKLLNWASDIGSKLQSDTFKQLASGEPIEARLPYKEPFLLKNVCKFAFNTNTLPTDVEHTDAFFERFLIIPFEQYIPKEKRDPRLAEKIISKELPGVFNWVLDGLNRLIRQEQFSKCKASEKALREFRKESDSVALFTDEMGYKATPNEWTKAKPIYEDYRTYCFAEGLKPLSRKNFHRRLENLGFFSGTRDIGKVLYMRKFPTNDLN